MKLVTENPLMLPYMLRVDLTADALRLFIVLISGKPNRWFTIDSIMLMTGWEDEFEKLTTALCDIADCTCSIESNECPLTKTLSYRLNQETMHGFLLDEAILRERIVQYCLSAVGEE